MQVNLRNAKRLVALALTSATVLGGVLATATQPAIHADRPRLVIRANVTKTTLLSTIRRAQAVQTNHYTPTSVATV